MSAIAASTPNDLALATADRLASYAQASKAPATWRKYRACWRHVDQWASDEGVSSWPLAPDTLMAYLDHLAETGFKASTIQGRLSAIAQRHRAAKLPSPTDDPEVKMVWAGIRRTIGTAQQGVEPATVDVIRQMVDALPDTRRGVRDRAIILLGFAGAFRRSELAGLTVDDLKFTDDGIRVALRRSKTDQEGEGRTVGIPAGTTPQTCPVTATAAWVDLANPQGRLFGITGQTVARRVKRAAKLAGLDPAQFAGHSLRAGFATSAAAAGASERSIMRQTGHRSLPMVRRYIREGSVFIDNAAAKVGL